MTIRSNYQFTTLLKLEAIQEKKSQLTVCLGQSWHPYYQSRYRRISCRFQRLRSETIQLIYNRPTLPNQDSNFYFKLLVFLFHETMLTLYHHSSILQKQDFFQWIPALWDYFLSVPLCWYLTLTPKATPMYDTYFPPLPILSKIRKARIPNSIYYALKKHLYW